MVRNSKGICRYKIEYKLWGDSKMTYNNTNTAYALETESNIKTRVPNTHVIANDTMDDLQNELELRYGCAFAQWTIDNISQ